MKPGITRSKIFLLILVFLAHSPGALGEERSGTVPFIFDDNRIFAELRFIKADGTERTALAFVDLGTPQLVMSENLRRELQLGQTEPVVFRVGGAEIKVDPSAIATDSGFGMTGPNGKRAVRVEAVLGGGVMKHFVVSFDYGRRTLTFAPPDHLNTEGDAVPCRVNKKSGLVSVTAGIGGNNYNLAIDCGSAYTWIRNDVAEQWVKDYPDWKRGTGAVGEANMQTRADGAEARATILRVPEINIGRVKLKQIGAIGIAPAAPPVSPAPGEGNVEGDFFDWYSKKAPERVDGWLGGNVLKGFRLTIDFATAMTYWEREVDLDPRDLYQVGITLETRDNVKGYFIAGIATTKDGKPAVQNVRVGDKLLQVDNVIVSDATRGAIFAALHGKPGTTRTLLLERNGQQVSVRVLTSAF
jgi:hypothetical protein